MIGDTPLESPTQLYSEAAELAKKCREYIVSAKLAVEQTEMK